MGIENEFAFRATDAGGRPFGASEALRMINARIGEKLAHLPSISGGIFTANGGRLYIDNGGHNEWCTPESSCPTTVVRHLLAGERMLASAADALVADGTFETAVFAKINVDYSGAQTSWGAHESYFHTCSPSLLPPEMIPFLASRLIFSGAGGWDPTSPTGCYFTLSPRAAFVNTAISGSSTHDRGIFHTKDEPLAGSGHRLHVLVGESLCSSTGNWLKMATTALCVAMVEAGLKPGAGVALHDPVQALRTYAADPTCRATAQGAAGPGLTALEIQRHYLALAAKQVGTPEFPAWAAQAIEAWDNILKRLERGPAGVADCLDWGIKRLVFESCVRSAGFSWESLGWWNSVHSILRSCGNAHAGKRGETEISTKYILDQRRPLWPIVRELTPHLLARDMKWEQFDAFLKLRLQLFELDVRFGQLGAGGIFNSLDAAGVLAHAFPGVDCIEQAITEPPARGRANLRGRMIRKLHGHGTRYACYWDRLIDQQENRVLDLSDPLAEQERWRNPDAPPTPANRGPAIFDDSAPD
jgi:hypothetical protein